MALYCECEKPKPKYDRESEMPICQICDKPGKMHVRYCDFCERDYVPLVAPRLYKKFPELTLFQRLDLPVACEQCRYEHGIKD